MDQSKAMQTEHNNVQRNDESSLRPHTRRGLLRAAGGAALAGAGWSALGCVARPQHIPPANRGPWRAGVLPAPDLSDQAVLRYDAGIRPYRRGSVRLGVSAFDEITPGQRWVHNYGHGGSGWTLSWGCAERVADDVMASDTDRLGQRDRGARGTASPRVAVLGGGIIGLTTAMELTRRRVPIVVYANQVGGHTTSAKAGAQFAPSLVAWDETAGVPMSTILRATHRAYLRSESDPTAGVHRKTNFTAERGGGALRGVPDDLSNPRDLDQLPFAELPGMSGRAYDTLHLEPPKYLARLQAQLLEHGVRFESRRFGSLAEIAALPHRTVVNCLGLGAGSLLKDHAVVPVRGQLVHLKPQPALTYLFSHRGYMFPRSDAVVLGGTIERDEADATPVEADCRAILAKHRAFWGVSSDAIA
ncbi:MAG: FAD-dependent oxidoreductase [Planctomycetota bacterium]